MTSTAYADPILLSTYQADQSILARSSAVLRALRLFQHQAESRGISDGRGTVWRSVEWLADKLGVTRAHVYKIFRRLRLARWIVDAFVVDEHGCERPGFCVALDASSGFATFRTPSGHSPDTLQPPSGHSLPTIELNESLIQSKSVTGRKPTQSSLPGASFEVPKEELPKRMDGKNRRDPRLREHAIRVDEYERKRYREHPRCTRPKRDTMSARSNSIEAITKAMERVIESGEYESDGEYEGDGGATFEAVELRFRAVVELNFESAERKIESWDWWSGSAMWTPSSLDRVLEWLSEPRNWIYIERARNSPMPVLCGNEPSPNAPEISELSPQEQQADYNRRHGISSVDWTVKSAEQVQEDAPRMLEAWCEREGYAIGIDPAVPGGDEAGVVVWEGKMPKDAPREIVAILDEESFEKLRGLGGPEALFVPGQCQFGTHHEQQAAGAMIDSVGEGDGSLDAVIANLIGGVAEADGVPAYMLGGKPKSDDELRMEAERKSAYVKTTTPEERAEDSKAGRKPWEVK